MKLYVATKWQNLERAREVMDLLQSAGHSITYDWTRQEQESAKQAQADIDGVTSADALVLIVEKDFPYRGALVEFGAALGKDKPCLLMGHAIDDVCLFARHPLVRYTTFETLLPDVQAAKSKLAA